MLAPHALRFLLLAAACAAGAEAWRRHGVTREHADRLADVRRHLAAGRLRAALELASLLAVEFPADAEARRLSAAAAATVRANELLGARRPAQARELLEPLARDAPELAVVHLLLGRARQQTGDRAGAEAALARFRELAPDGLRDPEAPDAER
jgi:tetratricopeptide (TPR) repeat protein